MERPASGRMDSGIGSTDPVNGWKPGQRNGIGHAAGPVRHRKKSHDSGRSFVGPDGTLVDSDPAHFRSFHDVAARHGVTIDEEFFVKEMSGASNTDILRVYGLILPLPSKWRW